MDYGNKHIKILDRPETVRVPTFKARQSLSECFLLSTKGLGEAIDPVSDKSGTLAFHYQSLIGAFDLLESEMQSTKLHLFDLLSEAS